EMEPAQLQQILRQVQRVLKPGGYLALVDFHQPTNPLFIPGLSLFLLLFETEMAWTLIRSDLAATLRQAGLEVTKQSLHAGGSLQVIQAQK
ncbi:MAG TPA: SAM-dependent methyltransferase, partial [Thermosynechococcaceae cyanobacterium]